jgi:peptide/nickel transport system permease protein
MASQVAKPVAVRTSPASRLFRWGRHVPHEVHVGAAIVLVIVVAALLAPVIAPFPPNKPDVLNSLEPPSTTHWMGTDDVGRDVFSRVLYGTRTDLLLVVTVALIGFVVGTLMGAIAGYYGRTADIVISRVGDTAVALPFLIVILAIVAILGVGTFSVCFGIVLVGWAFYARLARTEMIALREQEFVLAARALGFTNRRILLRHVLPNAVQPGLIYATVDSVSILVALAAMSYLGFGAQPPDADLGSIIAGGQPYLLTAWWICTLPALLLVALGIGIGLIGDGLTGREYDRGGR